MPAETRHKKRKSSNTATSPTTKKPKKAVAFDANNQSTLPEPGSKPKSQIYKHGENQPVGASRHLLKRAPDVSDDLEQEVKTTEKAARMRFKKAKREDQRGSAELTTRTVETANDTLPDAERDPAATGPVIPDNEQLAIYNEADDEDERDLSEIHSLSDITNMSNGLQVTKNDATPGVVYIGRIPHGFYEHQMRAYLLQFGDVSRLRMARNKKTGHSKHYAFVEFADSHVAKIVAQTMDKYLMFGHILQVRYIPASQVHPELFKGSNKRFKAAPRNKMQGRHLRLGMDRSGWNRRIDREEKRRKGKESILKEMGYEFAVPPIKRASKPPKKRTARTAIDGVMLTPISKRRIENKKDVTDFTETVGETKKSMEERRTAIDERKASTKTKSIKSGDVGNAGKVKNKSKVPKRRMADKTSV